MSLFPRQPSSMRCACCGATTPVSDGNPLCPPCQHASCDHCPCQRLSRRINPTYKP